MVASVIGGSGVLSASGGLAGNGAGNGSDGRIRLEAFTHNFSGTFDPVP